MVDHYREIQKGNFRKIDEIINFLNLDEKNKEKILKTPSFPFNLPRRLAEKIEKNNLDDPILRQFIPLTDEKVKLPGYLPDPVDDLAFCKSGRLLQKYHGRALLIATGACAMHCRYCFRQNFDYASDPSFQKELNYLKNNPSIHEVILSGGDPLSLSNKRLGMLFDEISKIESIKIIRIHTRFPIGIPERIDSGFLDLIKKCPLSIIFALHCNHPKELDEEIKRNMLDVKNAGALLINQSVLLKGINDDIETLSALSFKLIEASILPYYLHQFDPIEGGSHFEVSIEKGLKLIEELRERLPGYAVPRYVQEIPHRKSKTPLTSDPLSSALRSQVPS
ncbi:MAG: KamA family radical SAM protein [Simkaniaceae bacterium]